MVSDWYFAAPVENGLLNTLQDFTKGPLSAMIFIGQP
jgi:hypothetical protein